MFHDMKTGELHTVSVDNSPSLDLGTELVEHVVAASSPTSLPICKQKEHDHAALRRYSEREGGTEEGEEERERQKVAATSVRMPRTYRSMEDTTTTASGEVAPWAMGALEREREGAGRERDATHVEVDEGY